MANELLIVGLSHHTAPVEIREKLALSDGRLDTLLPPLVAERSLHEVVAVSTCNRVEVVAYGESGKRAAEEIRTHLCRSTGVDDSAGGDWIFELRGREAVRHLFRVASSLDSMVVGEPQILGQLKDHYARCSDADAVGPILHRVFHKSFAVAKRVRSETGIAERSVSVASAAVDLAGRIFETLEGTSVMLIGAGEIAEAAAQHLIGVGVSRVMVANRTFDRGVELARELGGTAVPIERMHDYLSIADLVVGSAGGGQLISADDVAGVLRERRQRPVFFIDLAVPRNFDPAINELDNTYLYDVDDLSSVVEENRGERQREAVAGEVIVEEEVDVFWRWLEQLDVVPTIVELRDHAERVRSDEVAKTLARIESLDDKDREKIDQMTRSIVKKLLHEPTRSLKQDRDERDGLALVSAVRELFGLGKKR